MIFLAFIAGLMMGGTVGVLVAALCVAAWRSDRGSERQGRAAQARAAAAESSTSPVPVGAD